MNKYSVRKLMLILVSAVLLLLIAAMIVYNADTQRKYNSDDFLLEYKSPVDFDNDGIDDYTDIYLGAKEYLKNCPPYKSVYYEGGYPTDQYAVCTDVIWAAMKNAGYNLKDAVDKDIAENPDYYFDETEKPDPNIDFRRVRNLKKYFDRTAESLTLDTSQIEEWLPGDIVVFKKSHIAIISDRRNKDGVPYILHQSGRTVKEADMLNYYEIDGHYRITGDYKYVT